MLDDYTEFRAARDSRAARKRFSERKKTAR
jgi:hypothetical protein